jgi:hypothetical protein
MHFHQFIRVNLLLLLLLRVTKLHLLESNASPCMPRMQKKDHIASNIHGVHILYPHLSIPFNYSYLPSLQIQAVSNKSLPSITDQAYGSTFLASHPTVSTSTSKNPQAHHPLTGVRMHCCHLVPFQVPQDRVAKHISCGLIMRMHLAMQERLLLLPVTKLLQWTACIPKPSPPFT